MKKSIILALVLVAPFANANITLQLSDEVITNNSKLCVYSDSNYDFTYEVAHYQNCPSVKTFSTDD